MKQNITAEEWGRFERANKKAAQKLRDYYADYQAEYAAENDFGYGCVLREWLPFFAWFTVGRMIEFLDINRAIMNIARPRSDIMDGWCLTRIRLDENQSSKVAGGGVKHELCDALWETVKEVVREDWVEPMRKAFNDNLHKTDKELGIV